MRSSLVFITLVATCVAVGCATTQRFASVEEQLRFSSSRTVEAGCASCIFHMKGVAGCKLAVRIDGKPYLVAGSDIDDHGDAHAPDGLCNVARKARVEGKVDGGKFVATRFALQP